VLAQTLWAAAARDVRVTLVLLINAVLRGAVVVLQQLADAIALLGVAPR